MNKVKGFLALFLAAIIFASFSIFIRLLSSDLMEFQQIGFRNFVGFLIGTLVVLFTKQSFASVGKVSPRYTLLYTLSFPLSVIFYTFAILQTKILTTLFGFYTGSLITSLVIGVLAFNEKIDRLKAISIGLVLLGFVSYMYPFTTNIFTVGFLLAMIGGFFDTVANSFRKYLAGKIDRFVLVVLQMVGGIAVAFPLMALSGQLHMPSISPLNWVIGIVFGGCLVVISYLLLVGFQNFDLNLGTVVMSSEMFFASVLAFIIFKEPSLPNELLGGALIILATVVVNFTIEKEGKTHRFARRALANIGIKI